MEEKFIIKKAQRGALGWSYIGKAEEKDEYIASHFEDRMISTDPQDAERFDSYDDAKSAIIQFGQITIKEKKEGNKTLVDHVGAGLYQIEKIFVIPQNKV